MNSVPPPEYNYSWESSLEHNGLLPQYNDPLDYDYSPKNGRIPKSEYLYEYSHYSRHGYGAKISSQADGWIFEKAPGAHLNSCEKIHRLTTTANLLKSKITPLSATRAALDCALHSRQKHVGF